MVSCEKPRTSYPQKTLRISIQREPYTLDPRKGGDMISASVHFLLYDGLTRLNTDGSITLSGAEKVAISKDQTSFIFTLRKSFWSDMSPITAYDYENSWKKILDPSFPAPNSYLLYIIKNAEEAKKGNISADKIGIFAKDNQTLVVTLEKPCPYFLAITAFCTLFPYKEGCYNGPFFLEKWEHQSHLHLKKNPFYALGDQISLDRIELLLIPDPMTALQLYEQNLIDIIGAPVSSLPLDAIEKLRAQEKFYHMDAAGTCFCVFNTEKYPFHNRNLRKAFGLSIHRKEIVTHITQLNEKIATGIIPHCFKETPEQLFQDDDTKSAQACFEMALEELGLSCETFPIITFYYAHSETNHLIAQILKEQWQKKLGIEIELQSLDTTTLLEKFAYGDFQMGQATYLAQYFDSINLLERFKDKQNRKNYAHWENQTFASLIESSHCTSNRMKILLEAEKILIDEMPIIPLFHTSFAYLIKPHLENVAFTPMGSLYFEKISTSSSTKAKEL